MNATARAALDLAAIGGHVLPIWTATPDGRCACGNAACRSQGKHPLGELVAKGLTQATTNPTTISRWFDRRPDANLGVGMAPSGWLALDVDGYHGDVEKLAALIRLYGPLPPTVTQRSGSGDGFHVIFQAPPFRPRGSLGGIVVRSNAYLVVAPSRHRSGGAYRWESGCEPGKVAVAPLPESWLEALRPEISAGIAGPPIDEPAWMRAVPQEVRIARMREHLAREKGEVMGRDRAGMTFDVTRTCVRGFAIRDPEAVLTALREIYNPRCKPRWDDGRLARKVVQSYSRATAPEWGDNLLALDLIGRLYEEVAS